MDFIADKEKAIKELNEVINHSESAKRIAQDLDDIIFDYIIYQATSLQVMTEHETDKMMTARLVRDFFYSLSESTESNKPK